MAIASMGAEKVRYASSLEQSRATWHTDSLLPDTPFAALRASTLACVCVLSGLSTAALQAICAGVYSRLSEVRPRFFDALLTDPSAASSHTILVLL